MTARIFQVDAFAEKPFSGNPAAVCLISSTPTDEWMQLVAAEMNLSETAFPIGPDANGVFGLRWFTPRNEVALCGHATLASAHILWETSVLKTTEKACFSTQSGMLTAERTNDGIWLDFPALKIEPLDNNEAVSKALGVQPINLLRSKGNYLVELDCEETVRSLTPDFAAIENLPAGGVIVTSRADGSEFDFVSRYFAPAVGINEDPVTGSAHCSLAVYWNKKLRKSEMTAYQASQRGGIVRVALQRDRVLLGGQAITIFNGELAIEIE